MSQSFSAYPWTQRYQLAHLGCHARTFVTGGGLDDPDEEEGEPAQDHVGAGALIARQRRLVTRRWNLYGKTATFGAAAITCLL